MFYDGLNKNEFLNSFINLKEEENISSMEWTEFNDECNLYNLKKLIPFN